MRLPVIQAIEDLETVPYTDNIRPRDCPLYRQYKTLRLSLIQTIQDHETARYPGNIRP